MCSSAAGPGSRTQARYSPPFAAFCNCSSSSTTEKGQPPVCCDASGCTTSSTRCGFASSLYFFNCQLFTTAPRFEISTRYRLFSTTIVRSCESVFTATLAAGAAVLVDGTVRACDGFAAGDVAGPGVAGADCAGRVGLVGWDGGLG